MSQVLRFRDNNYDVPRSVAFLPFSYVPPLPIMYTERTVYIHNNLDIENERKKSHGAGDVVIVISAAPVILFSIARGQVAVLNTLMVYWSMPGRSNDCNS
jgi:hypothetical protein